jgi:peptidoglycan/LPS O-acetylase OafA/YrhL
MTQSSNIGTSRSALINGLRGVAVILVLGFHFDVPLFGRGYWGVDLFFWISGFLITGGFLREYSTNRDSNQKFGWIDTRYYFLRRIRRLLPLSFLVLAAVVTLNLIFGGEDAVSQTLRRIPRILSFTFNMQLQSDAQDYFLKTIQDYGLLHYWSLAVEEQIYLISPFLFLFSVSFHGLKFFGYRVKWYQRVLGLNIILSITSFWFMLKQNQINSIANYYSTFSRFWEFGLGAIVATLTHIGFSRKVSNQVRIYLIHTSSLTMILSFIFLKNDGFGPLVLLPLVATSIFVLFAFSGGTKNFLSRVLKIRLFQFFGDIAFPLYLVHWPVMVLLRNSPDQSNLINIGIYLASIIVISYLLHRFVETPVLAIDISRFQMSREISSKKHHPRVVRRLNRLTIITVIALIVPMAFLSYPKEIKQSFVSMYSFLNERRYGTVSEKSSVGDEESTEGTNQASPETTLSENVETITNSGIISGLNSRVENRPSLPPEVAKPGVRFDAGWTALLLKADQTFEAKKSYVKIQTVLMAELRKSWNSGCLDSKSFESACSVGSGEKTAILIGDSFSFALKEALISSKPTGWKLLILTKGSCLPWNVTQYNENGTIKADCSDHITWVQDYISSTKPSLIVASGADQWLTNSSYEQWLTGFRSAIKFYSANSEKVVVVSSAPGSGNLKNCVGSDLNLRKCFGSPNAISRFVDAQKRESQSLNFQFIDLVDYLCINSRCPALINDTPVYADGSHLSGTFSKQLGSVFKNLRIFD